MQEKQTGKTVLKVLGVLLILFAAVYAIVGTLALLGKVQGVLPGHEMQETLVIILAYAVALFALIGGISGLIGAAGACKTLGLILAVLGLIALIYLQITQHSFNFFDCIGLVLGVAMFGAGKMAEKP